MLIKFKESYTFKTKENVFLSLKKVICILFSCNILFFKVTTIDTSDKSQKLYRSDLSQIYLVFGSWFNSDQFVVFFAISKLKGYQIYIRKIDQNFNSNFCR